MGADGCAQAVLQLQDQHIGYRKDKSSDNLDARLHIDKDVAQALRAINVLQESIHGASSSSAQRARAAACLSLAKQCIQEAVKERNGDAEHDQQMGHVDVQQAIDERMVTSTLPTKLVVGATRLATPSPPSPAIAIARTAPSVVKSSNRSKGAPRPASPSRRYKLRERPTRALGDVHALLPLGFRSGVWRSVPRREGVWPGGRLLITEVFGNDVQSPRLHESMSHVSASEIHALTAAAEALYRERLPGLNVIQQTQGGSKYDFVVDSLMHSDGAVTAVLQVGVAELKSAYVDSGDEASVAGAITLRVRRSNSSAALDRPLGEAEESMNECIDCGRVDCNCRCGAYKELTSEQAYGEVLACAVSTKHVRCGIGRLLVAWATLNAQVEGLRFLLVSASTDVVDFWERLGFGTPPTYCQGPCRELQRDFDDSVVLHLELPHPIHNAGQHGRSDADESKLNAAIEALHPRSRSRSTGKKRARPNAIGGGQELDS